MRSRPARRSIAATRVAGWLIPAVVSGVAGGGGAEPSEESADSRAFFDVVPMGQVVLGPDRRIRLANAAAHRLLLPSGGELAGKTIPELLPPAAHFAVEHGFEAAAGASPSSAPILVDISRTNGSAARIEIMVVRIDGRPGAAYGAVFREVREPPSATGPASGPAGAGRYSLGELLMANRLRELV